MAVRPIVNTPQMPSFATVVQATTGSGTGHLVEFIFKELRTLGHELKEDFKDFVEPDEHRENKR
jgi:hypothetical protein